MSFTPVPRYQLPIYDRRNLKYIACLAGMSAHNSQTQQFKPGIPTSITVNNNDSVVLLKIFRRVSQRGKYQSKLVRQCTAVVFFF